MIRPKRTVRKKLGPTTNLGKKRKVDRSPEAVARRREARINYRKNKAKIKANRKKALMKMTTQEKKVRVARAAGTSAIRRGKTVAEAKRIAMNRYRMPLRKKT